jgi:hypothetical protein
MIEKMPGKMTWRILEKMSEELKSKQLTLTMMTTDSGNQSLKIPILTQPLNWLTMLSYWLFGMSRSKN